MTEKATEAQIGYANVLRALNGFNDPFEGKMEEMSKDNMSTMIKKLVYSLNLKRKAKRAA